MDSREQEVFDLLTANSGKMSYRELYQAIAPENRFALRKTLKRLQGRGSVKQSNVVDTDTFQTLHSVELVG